MTQGNGVLMHEKSKMIDHLKSMMITKLSFLHLHHFTGENIALEEFFDLVLVSPEDPVLCLFKNCDGMSLKEIREILSFGAELSQHKKKKVKSRQTVVVLTFSGKISKETIKQILDIKAGNKRNYHLIIIDAYKKKTHYKLLYFPVFFLDLIFYLKKYTKSFDPNNLSVPIETSHEINIIENLENFQLNLFKSKAYMTWFLIFINIIMWFLVEIIPPSQNSGILIAYGAKTAPLIWSGEIWRLVTPVFLHVGFFHLFVNCIIIYILGTLLESVLGHWRMLLVYLFSGAVGNLLSLRFSPHLSAGASSGVFGILGAIIVYGLTYKKMIPRNFYKVIIFYLLPFLVYNLSLGFWYSRTDNYAHIGGLIGGTLISAVMRVKYPQNHNLKRRYLGMAGLAATFSLLFAYGMQPYPEAYRVYYSIQGELKAMEGSFAESIGYLEQSLVINPDNTNSRIMLGNIYYKLGEERYRMGKPSSALYYFKKASHLFPLSENTRDALSQLHEKIGDCYTAGEDYASSLKHFQYAEILSVNSEEKIRLEKIISAQYQKIASIAYEKFMLDEAEVYALKSLKKDPHNNDARKLLGLCYYRKGSIGKAANEWKEALELEPLSLEFKAMLEDYIFKNYWYKSNIPYLPHDSSEDAVLLNTKGEHLLMESGDYTSAEKLFHKALEIDPSYAAPLYNLAVIELMFDNISRGEFLVEDCLRIDPQYWEALALKGFILVSKDRFQEGEEYLKKALEIKPEYSRTYQYLGELYRRQRKLQDSIALLKKGLSIEPENVLMRMELAETYLEKGSIDEFYTEGNSALAYSYSQGREQLALQIRLRFRSVSEKLDSVEQVFPSKESP